jgi:hypothetical protein
MSLKVLGLLSLHGESMTVQLPSLQPAEELKLYDTELQKDQKANVLPSCENKN